MVTNVRDLLVNIKIEYERSLRALSDLQQRTDLLRDSFSVTTDNINKFVDSVNSIEDSVNRALQKLAEFPEEIPIRLGVQEGVAPTTTAAAGEREPGAILDPAKMAIQIANIMPILTTMLPQFFRGVEGVGGLEAGVPVEVTAIITDYQPQPLEIDVLLNQTRLQEQLNQLRTSIEIGGGAVQRGAAISETRQQPEELETRIRQTVTQRIPTADLPMVLREALRVLGIRRIFGKRAPEPQFRQAGTFHRIGTAFKRGAGTEEAVANLRRYFTGIEQELSQLGREQQIPQIPITPTVPAKPAAPAIVPPATAVGGAPAVPTLPSPIVIQIEGGLTTIELINQIADEIERRLRTRERVEFYG